MAKKVFSVFTFFLLAYFLISCTMTRPNQWREEFKVSKDGTILAEKFPEVFLKDKDGIGKIVKILELEGGNVVFLPSPYWNVQRGEIALEQISSIEFMKTPKRGGGFIAGFFLGYYTVGIVGLSTAKYNVDYEQAMSCTLLGGLGCGLLGLVLEAAVNPRPRTKFNFSEMSTADKVLALKNIMGANWIWKTE
jgi:hypothetical protein